MAARKENLKALFSNTRSRVIIVFTSIILILAVIIGFLKFTASAELGSGTSSNLPNAPGIQSIPGALDPTQEYAKLQEAQNLNQAQQAIKTGGSAIPTIIRSQQLGSGVQVIGSQSGNAGGVGFSALTHETEEGNQSSLWIQELQSSSCSKAAVQKVMNEGAQLSDVRAACSCVQLKSNGYALSTLQPVCSCKELRAAGFNARQLKDTGYSADELRVCGFDACGLRNSGFTAQAMKDGGFTDGELKGAGFPDDEIARSGGLPSGINIADVLRANCDVTALQRLRNAGVTAGAIRRISGCSADQLKAAGYVGQDLKNAGFSAADLKKAAFTAPQLKQAGYVGRDLLNAGFLPDDLSNAGYAPSEVGTAEGELPPGVGTDDIKKAGCAEGALIKERLAGISAKLIRQYAGCSAQALHDAGFTDGDLANAGFTPQQISATAPVDDSTIRAAGCNVTQLQALLARGVTAQRVHALNGCNAQALKAAGYSAKDLLDAGLIPQDLLAAGYNPDEIRAASVGSDAAIRAAGCDPVQLKTLFSAGVSARKIRNLNGCNATALKNAGYDPNALSDAGFTPEQILAAGVSPDELRRSGLGSTAVIAAGRSADCSVSSLAAAHAAGVAAATIKNTLGCSAAALKAAGYTAAELKAAGFTAAELKNAGFNLAQLKAAGFTAGELRAAGFNAQDLKNAGFSAEDLKGAGFTARQLKDAGFTPAELKDAGFSAEDLKNAGFTTGQIRAAGFSPAELQSAGLIPTPGSQVVGLPNQQATSSVITPPLPSVPGTQTGTTPLAQNTNQMQQIINQQNRRLADQRFQQKIQQRTSEMMAAANQSLQRWERVSTQVYVATSASEKAVSTTGKVSTINQQVNIENNQNNLNINSNGSTQQVLIKTGDVLFAVMDTSVNSDEPGPILATIVSGKLKGSKLIGSFNLPGNADKMVISFNTLSVPGASKTVSISAYAIDPETARTALSSRTDHHYLLRYGSLFASSFLEGIGNAFQSADTTVTVGGTGGGDNITVQNGINRSVLQNAVIALSNVGQAWGQAAQQNFNRPTTVQVFAGTGVGILFTQDLSSL